MEMTSGKKDYYLSLPNYPVQINITQYLPQTLDQLLDSGYIMSQTEWFSILFQITFGCAVAQKHFEFAHNDLHSSNIMFQPTKDKYIYFCIHNQYFRIPTFGRITKIIDFARGTFKLDGKWYFSDVFAKDGEAEGQYQYPKRAIMKEKPNPSFDLIRLATTIQERLNEKPKIKKLITKLMIDDNGNNVGEMKDSFDLYIHIAKYCHKAIPIKVLKFKEFQMFRLFKFKKQKHQYVYFY